MTIGVCDWGIGGLGFYKLLHEHRPDLDVVYLGDQGAVPYGRLPKDVLANRMRWVFSGFRDRDVSTVVVACNAASTVLDISSVGELTTIGVIRPALARLALSKSPVGIIGGYRTIRSGAYSRPLRKLGIAVKQRVAQPLSRLIEDGKADEPATHAYLRDLLQPLRDCERLTLACTHYSVLYPAIRTLLPGVQIIDPAVEVWKTVACELPPARPGAGSVTFYTTGDPIAMEVQSWNAFGVEAHVEPWS